MFIVGRLEVGLAFMLELGQLSKVVFTECVCMLPVCLYRCFRLQLPCPECMVCRTACAPATIPLSSHRSSTESIIAISAVLSLAYIDMLVNAVFARIARNPKGSLEVEFASLLCFTASIDDKSANAQMVERQQQYCSNRW